MRSTLKYDILCLRIVGVNYMKTKIIYISGNEIFDMSEIRAAFDEVRDALGLDNDTVLFGVPVDKDNAIEHTVSDDISADVATIPEFDTKNISQIIEEKTEPESISATENIQIETIEPVAETAEVDTPVYSETEKVIPILSVLATKKEESLQSDNTVQQTATDNPTSIEDTDKKPEMLVQTMSVTAATDNEVISETITSTIVTTEQSDDFADIIDEEAPKAPTKKTLEQLLESMTPLREDHEMSLATEDDMANDMTVFDNAEDSDDATLAQLASEFAKNADKIVTAPRPENHGKIGKLKNILPFKKAKRDDTGLMGDLFGWAGIAANDEDFSIPGFFTKKQGA